MSVVETKANIQRLPDRGIDLDNIQNDARRTVLVIDDEPDTITLLKHVFMLHGFNVAGANSGKEALRRFSDIHPTVVILDLLMPEMDGMQTLEEIHRISNVPVIMLSAVGIKEEIINALRGGTDDYLTKPFNGEELVARVEAILRRSDRSANVNSYNFPDIEMFINLKSYEVIYKGEEVQLTGKMFEVLELLARNAPKVVKYQELTTAIWGEDSSAVRNRLKYLIYLLRKEFLNIDQGSDFIQNVDRFGYKLVATSE